MNYYDNRHLADLEPCSVCGKFAGVRKYTPSYPEKFFVVCQSCGHKTRAHATQREATKEWNRKGR